MAYRRMTGAERDQFLRTPVRPAILATTRSDGRAHAAPVWYAIDGDTLCFTTGADTVKGRNLARDPRATLCVQDDQPPFSFVMLERNGVPGELLVRFHVERAVTAYDVAD